MEAPGSVVHGRQGKGDASQLLHGRPLRVVDLGVGMAAALVAKHFSELGADIFRIEPVGGDPFYDRYPAYGFWRKRAKRSSARELEALLADADLCILGGEDDPSLPPALDPNAMLVAYPRLVIVSLIGGVPNGQGGHDAPARAVDLLAQARTGAALEQFSDRANAAGLPLASYGAALLGMLGAWSSLIARERGAQGSIVSASLAAGLAVFWAPFWMHAEHPDERFIGITPKDVSHLLLHSSDGGFVQITMGVPEAEARVHAALGIPGEVDRSSKGMPRPELGPSRFFGNVALFNQYSRVMTRDRLLAALHAEGVPAEPALPPGANWADEQVRVNGTITEDDGGYQYVGSPLCMTPGPIGEPMRIKPGAGTGPLSGLRVVDLGIFVAGPYAAKLLADLGADVVHVEPPSVRPTLSGERTIVSANFGKRSICVDAKQPQGASIVKELCAASDVVLANFRPGVAKRLGLDVASLRAIKPSLITLDASAYGAVGPKCLAPGFDMVMQAYCGLQHRAGGADGPPLCSRTPMIDFAAGAIGAVGVMAALYRAMTTGRATAVETSLLDVGLFLSSEAIKDSEGVVHGVNALDDARAGFHPAERIYRTADGWIALAVRSNKMATDLSEVLRISLAPEYKAWSREEASSIGAATQVRTTESLRAEFSSRGIWAEKCELDGWSKPTLSDYLVQRIIDPRYGVVAHCMDSQAASSLSPPPEPHALIVAPGADGRTILREVGWSDVAIEQAIEAGVLVFPQS